MSRKFLIGTAVVGGLVAVALVVVPFVMDASTSGMVVADATAIVTVVIAVLAIVSLRRDSTGEKSSRRIKARGRGAIAAGRDITGNATGSWAKTSGVAVPKAASEPATADVEQLVVEAHGDGALAAGQDVNGNATGDQSEAS